MRNIEGERDASEHHQSLFYCPVGFIGKHEAEKTLRSSRCRREEGSGSVAPAAIRIHRKRRIRAVIRAPSVLATELYGVLVRYYR
jgi:hypothetical protein